MWKVSGINTIRGVPDRKSFEASVYDMSLPTASSVKMESNLHKIFQFACSLRLTTNTIPTEPLAGPPRPGVWSPSALTRYTYRVPRPALPTPELQPNPSSLQVHAAGPWAARGSRTRGTLPVQCPCDPPSWVRRLLVGGGAGGVGNSLPGLHWAPAVYAGSRRATDY